MRDLNRTDTLRALELTIKRTKALGDWRGTELAAAAWHRVHAQTPSQTMSAGLTTRMGGGVEGVGCTLSLPPVRLIT